MTKIQESILIHRFLFIKDLISSNLASQTDENEKYRAQNGQRLDLFQFGDPVFLFRQVRIHGILIDIQPNILILDDGTGTIAVHLNDFPLGFNLKKGVLLECLGTLIQDDRSRRSVMASNIQMIVDDVHQECKHVLEIVYLYKYFYFKNRFTGFEYQEPKVGLHMSSNDFQHAPDDVLQTIYPKGNPSMIETGANEVISEQNSLQDDLFDDFDFAASELDQMILSQLDRKVSKTDTLESRIECLLRENISGMTFNRIISSLAANADETQQALEQLALNGCIYQMNDSWFTL